MEKNSGLRVRRTIHFALFQTLLQRENVRKTDKKSNLQPRQPLSNGMFF